MKRSTPTSRIFIRVCKQVMTWPIQVCCLHPLDFYLGTLDTGVFAQTPPITPSSLNTQVSDAIVLPSGQSQNDITRGTRPGGGGNLFRSFGDFNVPNNNTANFLIGSSPGRFDILARVIGENLSSIYGTIQTIGFELDVPIARRARR